MLSFIHIKKINKLNILNILTCTLFLALPYYLFNGKLFIGGDDSRLFYSYPYEFLKNVVYFSWINVSTVGTSGSQQFLLPFVVIWSTVKYFINNPVILSYFAFSLPLLFGFIFFQKFVKTLFSLKNEFDIEVYVGSLFYILSPILIIDQLFIFLIAVWLLWVIPTLGYLYLRYLETSNFRYVFLSMIFSFVLSFTFFTMPWLFGFLLPLCIGLFVLTFIHSKKEILKFIKLSVVYFSCLVVTHSFWIFGFIAPYFTRDENSIALKFVSKGFLDTFTPTILSTAKGFINYPLLNLFQRQIAFDFAWKLKDDFLRLYDKTFILNSLFIIILGIGVFNYKKYLNKQNRRTYLLVFFSFLISLYFFVVNIGPLKGLFLLLGKLPGFVMFRNFYDKFAPGYVILYSILITISLILFKKRYPRLESKMLYVFAAIIILNFSVVKSTVNSPLWTTENVHKTITLPPEYLDFMNTIKFTIPSTNTILSIPFGTSTYTVIKDAESSNVYVGISPVKIFSGVNDISGYLSFNFTYEANIVDLLIRDRKYKELNTILYNHAINYVLVTKNVPTQVLKSWIFEKHILEKQDDEFLKSITDKKIITSTQGNYELYTTKRHNSILESKNLLYKKINSVKYIANISNIVDSQSFKFNDSYHAGWKIYLQKTQDSSLCDVSTVVNTTVNECKEDFKFFDMHEMSYLWKKPAFSSSHVATDASTNEWTIDPNFIKNNFSKDYYSVNSDGSINIQFVMYYTPQLFFYYGSIVSSLALIVSSVYMVYRKYKIK